MYVRMKLVLPALRLFKAWDLGDIVGAGGTMMKTNKEN